MKQRGGIGRTNPYTGFFLEDYNHVIKVHEHSVKKNIVCSKKYKVFVVVDLSDIKTYSSHALVSQSSQYHSSILSKLFKSH